MTEQERDDLLRGLSPTEQLIYKTLAARGGPMTAPMLRAPVHRNDGLTFELRHLSELGLIKPLGKKAIDGKHPAAAYRIVALADVEKQRERFAVRSPSRRRHRRRRAGPGIAELREMERGDYEQWYQTRRRLLELTQLVVRAERMSFWEAAPEDERGLVLGELRDLQAATESAVSALEMREADDTTREKIEKLRATNGRTPPEAATSHRLAKKLEDKL
jgi:hypothetical protein